MSNPWYPKYPGDYLRDTRGLTLEEHGAYNLLLDVYYSTGEPLPPLEECWRLCYAMTASEQKSVEKVLIKYFTLSTDGCWQQKRAEIELLKQQQKAEKRIEKAKKAAEARWGKDAPSNAPSMPVASSKQCSEVCLEMLQPDPQPQPDLKSESKNKNLRDEKPPRHTFDSNLFFEEFWTAYPYRNQKKLNKKQALDQYRKHVKDEAQAKQILEAVKKYAIHTDAVKDAFRWIRDENYKEWITPDIREVDDGAGRQLIARYNNSELQMLKNDRDLRQELGISEEELDSAFRLIADNADQPGRVESQCS